MDGWLVGDVVFYALIPGGESGGSDGEDRKHDVGRVEGGVTDLSMECLPGDLSADISFNMSGIYEGDAVSGVSGALDEEEGDREGLVLNSPKAVGSTDRDAEMEVAADESVSRHDSYEQREGVEGDADGSGMGEAEEDDEEEDEEGDSHVHAGGDTDDVLEELHHIYAGSWVGASRGSEEGAGGCPKILDIGVGLPQPEEELPGEYRHKWRTYIR